MFKSTLLSIALLSAAVSATDLNELDNELDDAKNLWPFRRVSFAYCIVEQDPVSESGVSGLITFRQRKRGNLVV